MTDMRQHSKDISTAIRRYVVGRLFVAFAHNFMIVHLQSDLSSQWRSSPSNAFQVVQRKRFMADPLRGLVWSLDQKSDLIRIRFVSWIIINFSFVFFDDNCWQRSFSNSHQVNDRQLDDTFLTLISSSIPRTLSYIKIHFLSFCTQFK